MADQQFDEDRIWELLEKVVQKTASPEERVEFLTLTRDLVKSVNEDIDNSDKG